MLIVAPTIIGATIFLLLASVHSATLVRGRVSFALVLVSLGSGGVAGNLFVAILAGWLDRLGITVFTNALLALTLALSACGILALYKIAPAASLRLNLSGNPRTSPTSAALATLCAGTMFAITFHAWIQPIFAWDALVHWVAWAHELLAFDLGHEVVDGKSRLNGDSWDRVHGRHPLTIIYSSAFSAYANRQIPHAGWLSSWTLIWVCCAMVVWGFVNLTSRNTWTSWLALYGFLTMPLLENHASVVGYADLWNVVIVIVSFAGIGVFLILKQKFYLITGLVLSATLLLIKNTGIFYLLALLLPLIIITMKERFKIRILPVALIALTIITFILIREPEFLLLGKYYKLQFPPEGVVRFGGYLMPFEYYSIINIAENTVWALFVNQSFSVGALFLLIVSISAAFSHDPQEFCKTNMDTALSGVLRLSWLGAFCIILAFAVPQIVREYAVMFAEPSGDIGNSRFILPFVGLVILAVGPVTSQILKSGAVKKTFYSRELKGSAKGPVDL